ncbi:protein EFR3 homolog A-like [Argonauta hians]
MVRILCLNIKPKYKRYISKIYPQNPNDCLNKQRTDKLIIHALSKPDVVPKIVDNLIKRINRYIYRPHKVGYVFISMEALYLLFIALKSQGFPLYANSYLGIIKKLIDHNNIDLQVLATDYFISFTQLDEESDQYYAWYDVFIICFKNMCYCKSTAALTRYRIRVTGLRGIQGIVHKAVTHDQELNFFHSDKIQKIISSLLYNLEDSSTTLSPHDHRYMEDLASLPITAENIFRDLIQNASFGTIKLILKPILVHLDFSQLWQVEELVAKIFRIILESLNTKFSYLVFQMLVFHMSSIEETEPVIKTCIINVTFETIKTTPTACVFPTMLEVFDSLLNHLYISVRSNHSDWQYRDLEETFQTSTINTIWEIANRLTSYQKIDTMMFLLERFPDEDILSKSYGIDKTIKLQKMFLKIIYRISINIRYSVEMNAFTPEFLLLLFKISQKRNPYFRLNVEKILHELLDKHHNIQILTNVCVLNDLSGIRVDMARRHDVIFMRKNGYIFYQHIYENFEHENNEIENFKLIYCTMALIAVEFASKDILIDLIRLALDIQDMVNIQHSISNKRTFVIHGMIAAYFSLLTQLFFIAGVAKHIDSVIFLRTREAEALLPAYFFTKNLTLNEISTSIVMIQDRWLFSRKIILDRFQSAVSISVELYTSVRSRKLFESSSTSHMERIFTQTALDSDEDYSRGNLMSKEGIDFTAMKNVLLESSDPENQNQKQREIYKKFKNGSFEDIVKISKSRFKQFHSRLNGALDAFSDVPSLQLEDLKIKLEELQPYDTSKIPSSIY